MKICSTQVENQAKGTRRDGSIYGVVECGVWVLVDAQKCYPQCLDLEECQARRKWACPAYEVNHRWATIYARLGACILHSQTCE